MSPTYLHQKTKVYIFYTCFTIPRNRSSVPKRLILLLQVMEDSNLLLQIDLSSFERQLKSKTSKLEDSFKQLEVDVNDIKQKTRNLQRSMGSLESTHDQLVQASNATSKEVATLKMEVKLNVLNDWLPYNFDHAKSRTDCFGDQFVRRSTFKTGRLVGVVLCSRDRYKIFLGQSLTDTFKNIGDDVGMGEDHCQFVGATDVSKVKVSPFASSMETEQGMADLSQLFSSLSNARKLRELLHGCTNSI